LLPQPEIKALVHLLDDNDREVLQHVQERLKSYGTEIIPVLEDAWVTGLNPLQHERLEGIIHDLQFATVCEHLSTWAATSSDDLLEGFVAVSRYFYPDIDIADIRTRIYKIKQAIWLELNHNQTHLEQIQIFNQVFYKHLGYSADPDTEIYQDFCLPKLLDNRRGSPIALGLLYQIVAHQLHLPVYGVCLAGYYVLCFTAYPIKDFTGESLDSAVLFYINPLNRGTLFSRNEIKDYLIKVKIDALPHHYSPADNKQIVLQLLTYFITLAEIKKDSLRLNDFDLLRDAIDTI
jgi:regulator of sirC expression with transglutaminase-like and TPR domain